MTASQKKMLLHICCAPCAGVPIRLLRGEGYDLSGFWFNPNIHPLEEEMRRLESVRSMSHDVDMSLFLPVETSETNWQEQWPQPAGVRCLFCYETRMDATAAYAATHGFSHFSTSLTISPYQNQEAIEAAGEKAAARHGVTFLFRDFRPVYREGRNLARAKGWYMQKYCGCRFSYEDSDHPKKPVYEFL